MPLTLRLLLRPTRWWVLMILLLVGSQALAQDPFPYDAKTGREAGLLLISAGSFRLGRRLERDVRTLIPEEIDALDAATLGSLDRPATRYWSPGADRASDVLVYGQMAMPLGLALVGNGNAQPGKISLMYVETMVLNSGMTYLLKSAFQRSRPFVYNENPEIPLELKMSPAARRSFPSGHTATAFASMVFFASVYEELNPDAADTDLVWAGCLASATVTGVLRVRAGRHFTTDVLAGAALGAAVGYLVPQLHEISSAGEPGPAAKGFSLTYGFRF